MAMWWHRAGFERWLDKVREHMIEGFVLPEDAARFPDDAGLREAFFYPYQHGEDPVVAYKMIMDMIDAQEQLATTGIRS